MIWLISRAYCGWSYDSWLFRQGCHFISTDQLIFSYVSTNHTWHGPLVQIDFVCLQFVNRWTCRQVFHLVQLTRHVQQVQVRCYWSLACWVGCLATLSMKASLVALLNSSGLCAAMSPDFLVFFSLIASVYFHLGVLRARLPSEQLPVPLGFSHRWTWNLECLCQIIISVITEPFFIHLYFLPHLA